MAERPTRTVYFADEVAELLGMSVDTFYRRHDDLIAAGMPKSLPGKYRFDKASFDAWRLRQHPQAAVMKPAANDAVPYPQQDEAHRAALRAHYARR